jgi:hypothetical protein
MRVPRCRPLLLTYALLLLALLLVAVNAISATGDRVLVIHEEDSVQSDFSQFFDSLKGIPPFALCKSHSDPFFLGRGYQLTFLNPKRDPSSGLTKYEERQYDHIVLFPQKLKGRFPTR